MADTIDRRHRSWVMGRIRSSDTKPEILVRSLLHRCGYRFSLKAKGLPVKPDMILPKYKVAVFVHGCFWHLHGVESCGVWKVPKSNTLFWEEKLARTVERDKQNTSALQAIGWCVITIWECEVEKSPLQTLGRLLGELESVGGKAAEKCLNNLGDIECAVRKSKIRHRKDLIRKTGQKVYDRK
jgi:DNA mismatch endonuclease, patch repair protein